MESAEKMGESACLRRSFSDSSSDPRMGDAIRALGDSISFGRFLSETLAWEKWSSFSQNRYLEEAEKFSKPGSVAQKKAYFEAHYKRFAARKAAEAEAASNDFPGPKALDDLNTVEESSHMMMDELDGKEEAPSDPLDVGCVGKIESVEIEVEETERMISPAVTEESPAQTGFSDPIENVEEERIPPLEVVEEEENLALRGDKKQENPSSKPSAQGQVFKLGASPAKITSSAHFRKERSDQKRFTPKSVHMSINFASLAAETTKKASPALQTNRNSKINAVTTKMTKESLIPKRPMTRASMNGISKHTLATAPQSGNNRAKTPLDESVSGDRTAEGKWRSPLAERPQLSSVSCGSKSRSPIISSPFRFRSEERVAKRKEFFEKLEEKNAKAAEKMQLQKKSKMKPETDLKQQRCSITFKSITTKASCPETEPPSNHIKKDKGESELKKLRHSFTFKPGSCPETDSQTNHKKTLPQPHSPKHGMKPTPGAVQDTNFRPPRVPSARSDSSKPAAEKNKLPPKKDSKENVSPNHQL